MKAERVVALTLLLLVAFLGGCSILKGKPTPVTDATVEQERHFAEALQYLKGGKEREAQASLEQVIASQPLPGVTDEALFRLALLHLQDESGKGDIHANALLALLKKEYPHSIWAQQSAPLIPYLDGVAALRESNSALNAQWELSQSQLRESQREVKALRERNHLLLHDNKELQKRLDRLKNLDLEIEQKAIH